MDTSPGTLGEFLLKALDAKILEQEERCKKAFRVDSITIRQIRTHCMLWIRRFEVAKQILKTLEEHELEFMIELTIEKELRKKLGRRDSILQKVEKAKKGILRKSPFRVKVTVLVGEAKIEVPAKYWEWAATKASR